jgi:hypothetical protein
MKKLLPIMFFMALITSLGCDSEQYLSDLKSSNIVIKREAIRKIGTLEIKEAVPVLINLLKEDSEEISADIIEALGKIGDNAAVKPLIAMLNKDNALIRVKAIEALGRIGDRKAVPALSSILEQKDSKSESDVLTAIWALGNIGDRSAEPTLNSLLGDNNKYVRYNVEQALKKIHNTPTKTAETDPARKDGHTAMFSVQIGSFSFSLFRRDDKSIQYNAEQPLKETPPTPPGETIETIPVSEQDEFAEIFTAQVGVFRHASHAEELKKRLEDKGYDTYITLSESKKNGRLYRVCIGKFSNLEKAEELAKEIKKVEGMQTFVIALMSK